MAVGAIILCVASTYISLDTAFSVSSYFETSPSKLHNAWIFSLTVVWPLFAVVAYFSLSIFVVVRILKERKPLLYFAATALLFALSQGAYYALSETICRGSNATVDGSFVATIVGSSATGFLEAESLTIPSHSFQLETASIVALYYSWKSITESDWDGTPSMIYCAFLYLF
jgi:hypothetical protein